MSKTVSIGNDKVLATEVKVAQNELMLHHVFNRGTQVLLSNDIALHEFYKQMLSQLDIVDYTKGNSYPVGKLVWFQDYDKKLYLLRCILPDNANEPNSKNFQRSGWEDKNPCLNILDYGIESLLSAKVEMPFEAHETDKDMHPFGPVSMDSMNPNYISKALLRTDLANISHTRETTFFPSQVTKLTSDNAILHGYMRVYDNKLLEYDIVFKLGSGTTSDNDLKIFDASSQLSANTAVFQKYAGVVKGNVSYQDNDKYFYNTSNMDIFAYDNAQNVNMSVKGMLKQVNRNDFVNTYSATIEFPKKFADRNYMVFSNSVLSQTNDHDGKKELVPSANDITVCDKTREHITFLDITFPDADKYGIAGSNAENNGLVANSFHCKIIGLIGASA